jgi:hypothetical protein
VTEIDDAPRLVMADLHNHSLLSDGRGDPEQAFAMMRASGLQVAALTDHAALPRELLPLLSLQHYPDAAALELARFVPDSIDEAAWLHTAELADAHDVPGQFTALRGFEWTEAWLGHVNVWFSELFSPMTTPGSLSGLFAFLEDVEPQALFGYNHPGREPGSLGNFARPVELDTESEPGGSLRRRMVSLEAFNRRDDYLFAGSNSQTGSAIVTCLDSGWRPTLAGASDEHGRSYGLAGKGRTGLWVNEHSRAGVREALLARRGFATREVGLRLHATLGGHPMGSVVGGSVTGDAIPTGEPLEMVVDLGVTPSSDTFAPDPALAGREVELQVITSGDPVHVVTTIAAQVGEVTRSRLVWPEGADWLVLRVADRSRGYGRPAPVGHRCSCWGLAYASPWFC